MGIGLLERRRVTPPAPDRPTTRAVLAAMLAELNREVAAAAVAGGGANSAPCLAAPPRNTAPSPRNEALLRQVLNFVTTHPEQHQQRDWVCELADGRIVGCVAYHTVMHAGHQVLLDASGRHIVLARTGGRTHIFDAAQRALGLTADEAISLFDPSNSVARLWQLAAHMTNGRVALPAGTGGAAHHAVVEVTG